MPLGALLVDTTGELAPVGGAGEIFEVYDFAAFGRGEAAAVCGPDAPARSRRVQPGDVLVSRATSAPRRAWVVAERAGRIPLASSEWLVLRPSRHDPAYLRQLLVSNAFHLRFMSAVGAAAHANPRCARLRAIALPVPPQARQQAIARVLDLADALRLHRRRALGALEELAALFQTEGSTGALAATRQLRTSMLASLRQLEALLSILRDRAFRDDLSL
jgi:type I restriction enzyme S subunit